MTKLRKSDFRYVVGIIFIGFVILVSRVLAYRKISDILYLCFVIITIIRCIIVKVVNRKLYKQVV